MKKKIYMAVTAIAVLCSCTNEEILESSINSESKVFTGVIESNITSRSTLNGMTPNWESTDIVSINGVQFSTTPGTPANTATFNSVFAVSKPYYAFFADGANTGTGAYNSTDKSYVLPAIYNCVTDESGNPKFNMPMYAYSASSTNLTFKNICGVLAVTVPYSEDLSSVSYIKVVSDQMLNGAFTVTDDAMTFTDAAQTDATDKNKCVTLNCATDVSLGSSTGDSKTFYLPVPPATNHKLTIEVYGKGSSGTASATGICKSMALTAAVEIVANKIYSIDATTFSSKAKKVENLLPGFFSVSANKKVMFTKSNVWRDTENNAFKFETNYNFPIQ